MSNLIIKRTVDNIRSRTNVYTPIAEVVVNAIEAIEERGNNDGLVHIRAIRSPRRNLDDSIPEICGFEISDNGIGFNDEHQESFDTLYSAQKLSEGGKGFGRFTCLKYYEDVHFKSVFTDSTTTKYRSFQWVKRRKSS